MDDIEECNAFLKAMEENRFTWSKYLNVNPLIARKTTLVKYTFIANISVNFEKKSVEMPLPKCIGANVFEIVKNRREKLIKELNSCINK